MSADPSGSYRVLRYSLHPQGFQGRPPLMPKAANAQQQPAGKAAVPLVAKPHVSFQSPARHQVQQSASATPQRQPAAQQAPGQPDARAQQTAAPQPPPRASASQNSAQDSAPRSARHPARRSSSITFGDASTVGVQARPHYETTQRLRHTPRNDSVNVCAGYPVPVQDRASTLRQTRHADAAAWDAPSPRASSAQRQQPRPNVPALRLGYDAGELSRLLMASSEGIRRSQRFECRPESARGHVIGGSVDNDAETHSRPRSRGSSAQARRNVDGSNQVIIPDHQPSSAAAAPRSSSMSRSARIAPETLPTAGASSARSRSASTARDIKRNMLQGSLVLA